MHGLNEAYTATPSRSATMDQRAPSSTEPPKAEVTAAERVVYVVARDLLPFERRGNETSFEFMRLVWRDRRLFLSCMALCILLSVAYALFASQWFLAETVLAPVPQQEEDISGLLSKLGDVSSLAGLAGLDIGKDKVDVPLAVLQSKDFARSFIEDNNLLHVVLAKYWDGTNGRWRTTLDGRTPDIRDAVKIFKRKIYTADEDKKTNLVTVSVEWKDPDTAALWANQLVQRANDRLRGEAISKAEAHIAYLQKALSATSAVSVQEALGRLMENETKKEMIARGNQEFAFRVIDSAHPAVEQDKPKRMVAIIVGILGGGIAGLLAVYLRNTLKMIRSPV